MIGCHATDLGLCRNLFFIIVTDNIGNRLRLQLGTLCLLLSSTVTPLLLGLPMSGLAMSGLAFSAPPSIFKSRLKTHLFNIAYS